MSDQAIAIGVDIGGSKMVLGIVGANGTVTHEQRVSTIGMDPAWVSDRIAEYAQDAGSALPVGVAANGPVDRNGIVRYGTFIPWSGYPLRDRLSQRLGVPVFVQNDVTVAAWGEYSLDPDRRSVVVMAVGTGIGGGAVIEGRLLIGKGAAMEIGHLPGHHSRVCVCGKTGCLEAAASGSAVADEYRARRAAAGQLALAAETGAHRVVQAANAGDQTAIDVLREAGAAIGEAAAILTSVLDPDRIVLTGGLVHGAGDLVFIPAVENFIERLAQPNVLSKGILEVSRTSVNPIIFGAGSLAASWVDIGGVEKHVRSA